MKLLITGSTGFIGSRIMKTAADRGYAVHALVRRLPAEGNGENISYFRGDITDPGAVHDAMIGCDAVIHAAGVTRLWHPDRSIFYRVHVDGTRNILESAIKTGVRKVVVTSTGAVFGASAGVPLNEEDIRITPFNDDYEVSKHCAEEIVYEYSRKIPAVIVNPTRVYGPGPVTSGNPLSSFIRLAMNNRFVIIPSELDYIANYAFIDDVVEGHFLALERGRTGEKYITGGENIRFSHFIRAIREHAPHSGRFISIPVQLLRPAVAAVYRIQKMLGKEGHISPMGLRRFLEDHALSCQKAVGELGYRITPFEEGIRKTINYLKTSHHE